MKIKNYLFVLLISILPFTTAANENFFEEAKKLFDNEDYENSKFLFQRNIVFNPKDAKSYLYLAKIFQVEENNNELEKNLDTALLLEPDNEIAMYMLIDIELKKGANLDTYKGRLEDSLLKQQSQLYKNGAFSILAISLAISLGFEPSNNR